MTPPRTETSPSAAPVASASHLRPEHARMLAESAIAPDLITPERYESVSSSARLRALGFSQTQAQTVPGLLITYHNAANQTFYQFRPDRKRDGGAKYETPPGRPGPYGLDIPDSIRERVLNSKEELWITEGGKKSDAGTSAGLCMVSLPGVWMFLRDKKPLPDFDVIPLDGRVVVIAYDSDGMTKEGVYGALRRLAGLLRKRGAVVRFCYLPDDGESKIGVDDFLASHTPEQMQMLVEERLHPVATAPITALINVLNRQCQGLGTFHPKRLEMAEVADEQKRNEQTLAVMKTVNDERTKIDEECRFWLGDAYCRLNLKHGEKLKRLNEAIGEAWTRQVQKWATVCRAFAGNRDYFRYSAPWWFLAEIASLDTEKQDDLLSAYLEAQAEAAECETEKEAREKRIDRDKLRALITSKYSAGGIFGDPSTSQKVLNLEWENLESYLPEQFLQVYGEAIALDTTVEVNRCILDALRAFKAKKVEEGLFKRSDFAPAPIDNKGDNLEETTSPDEPIEPETLPELRLIETTENDDVTAPVGPAAVPPVPVESAPEPPVPVEPVSAAPETAPAAPVIPPRSLNDPLYYNPARGGRDFGALIDRADGATLPPDLCREVWAALEARDVSRLVELEAIAARPRAAPLCSTGLPCAPPAGLFQDVPSNVSAFR